MLGLDWRAGEADYISNEKDKAPKGLSPKGETWSWAF